MTEDQTAGQSREDDANLDELLTQLAARHTTTPEQDIQARLDSLFAEYQGRPIGDFIDDLRTIGGLDRHARKLFADMISEGVRPVIEAAS